MPSARQYRYYFGVLLEELMDKIGVEKADRKHCRLFLHWIFKRYYKVYSTTDLPTSVMELYTNRIRIDMNVEFGVFLHEPNEGNVEDMDMKEFLNIKMEDYA
jgi:hypothetical protein